MSKDKQGIMNLFDLISEAVENEQPMNYTVNFSDNRITIKDSQGVNVGDDNTMSHNKF